MNESTGWICGQLEEETPKKQNAKDDEDGNNDDLDDTHGCHLTKLMWQILSTASDRVNDIVVKTC